MIGSPCACRTSSCWELIFLPGLNLGIQDTDLNIYGWDEGKVKDSESLVEDCQTCKLPAACRVSDLQSCFNSCFHKAHLGSGVTCTN